MATDISFATNESQKHRIDVRLFPCRCGCNGSDPWHKASYRRRVSGIVAGDAEASNHCMEWKHDRCLAVGFARLPGAKRPVRCYLVGEITPYWVVDCADLLDARNGN